MKHPFERIYTQVISRITSKLLYMRAPFDGTIVRCGVWQDNLNFQSMIYNLRVNGVTQFTGSGRMICGGVVGSSVKTGLSIPVLLGQTIEIYMDAVSQNQVNPNFVFLVEIDDGSNTLKQVILTTTSLANLAEYTGTMTLGQSFIIAKVASDKACRFRAYRTAAYRTADSARAIGTDPTGEHGLIVDVVTTVSNLGIDLEPLATGVNGDDPQVSDVYVAVQNKSGSTGTVQVTVDVIKVKE
jgi:hypothetical protein